MRLMTNTRIFIKVDDAWLTRFETYCATTGQTKSGAVRAALEQPMLAAEKGRMPSAKKWGNMNAETKKEVIREHGNDFSKVAETYDAAVRAVERFAYRNDLIGPGAVKSNGGGE